MLHGLCPPGSGKECALHLLVEGIADQLVLLRGGVDLQAHPPNLQTSVQAFGVQHLVSCQGSSHGCSVMLCPVPLLFLFTNIVLMQVMFVLGLGTRCRIALPHRDRGGCQRW